MGWQRVQTIGQQFGHRFPGHRGRCRQTRITHERGAIRSFLSECEPGTSVAVEATGNWYWIVDEIEAASLVPKLVHPRKAKLMMGSINKTDKLDVHGLNRLQRTGTLPTVWIPPGELRDLRAWEARFVRAMAAAPGAGLSTLVRRFLGGDRAQISPLYDAGPGALTFFTSSTTKRTNSST